MKRIWDLRKATSLPSPSPVAWPPLSLIFVPEVAACRDSAVSPCIWYIVLRGDFFLWSFR